MRRRRVRYIPKPTPLPSKLMLLSCLTVTLSGLILSFDILSQMGSTSGPSRSPAPSQPQHHTAKSGVLAGGMHRLTQHLP